MRDCSGKCKEKQLILSRSLVRVPYCRKEAILDIEKA